MHFKELINSRFSLREYHDSKIDRKLIEQLIYAAQLAPSACNKQPWHFVYIDEDIILENVKKAYDKPWFKKAPNIIIAYAKCDDAWVRESDSKNFAWVDVSIAISHITLMATQLGLGTCWVCNFDNTKLAEAISTPQGYEPVALIPVGYPNISSSPPIKKRKSINDILSFNKID